MREHQIVITLKPDQFVEVQRLARAANAKSMGIFVRQKLLAALGIEGVGQATGEAVHCDIQPLVDELRHLHCELKSFVAESLSIYLPDASEQPSESLVVAVEGSLTGAVGHADEDEVEEAAGRAFAISPRLGAVETGEETRNNRAVPENAAMGEPSTPIADRHEILRRRDIHRSHQEADIGDAALPAVAPDMVAGPGGTVAADPGVSAAFGWGVEPAESSVRDPLSQLLGPDEPAVDSAPAGDYEGEDEDDYDFDVPMSLAERQRMLAAAQDPAAYQPAGSEIPASGRDSGAADQTGARAWQRDAQGSEAPVQPPLAPAGLTEQIRAARAAAEQIQAGRANVDMGETMTLPQPDQTQSEAAEMATSAPEQNQAAVISAEDVEVNSPDAALHQARTSYPSTTAQAHYSTGRWVSPAETETEADKSQSDEPPPQNRPPNLPLSGGPPPKRRRV